jgi:hypothetical protein
MLWMIMTALWIVMLAAPLVLLVALLPSGRECPRCGCETLAIQPRILKAVRRVLMPRWCTACGWEGYARTVSAGPVAGLELTHHLSEESDDDAAWRGEQRENLG